MTSTGAHVHRTVANKISKMETYFMEVQQWNAETAPDKSKDAKQKRIFKSTNHIPPSSLGDSKADSDTDWDREISSSSDDSLEEEEAIFSKYDSRYIGGTSNN